MDRRGGWDLLGVTTGAFFVTMVARLVASPLVPATGWTPRNPPSFCAPSSTV